MDSTARHTVRVTGRTGDSYICSNGGYKSSLVGVTAPELHVRTHGQAGRQATDGY